MKSIHDPRYIEMIHHLKRIRKSNDISQDSLAKSLGIDRTHITKTETFVRRLDFIELCDWLDALGYSREAFMRENGRIERQS